MHAAIKVVTEGQRGCGYRQVGGMYLMFDGPTGSCGKLPVSLDALNRCPHCFELLPVDYGIRPSRAPRMLANPEYLWRDLPCGNKKKVCLNCPLSAGYETGPALLLWIGEQFYPTPADFNREAAEMGLSRRIPQIPKDFQVGETWVLLAHVKAIHRQEPVTEEKTGQIALIPRMKDVWTPGIFGVVRPTRIEVVVTGNEPDEEIDAMVKRGLSPVVVRGMGRKIEKQTTDLEEVIDD